MNAHERRELSVLLNNLYHVQIPYVFHLSSVIRIHCKNIYMSVTENISEKCIKT